MGVYERARCVVLLWCYRKMGAKEMSLTSVSLGFKGSRVLKVFLSMGLSVPSVIQLDGTRSRIHTLRLAPGVAHRAFGVVPLFCGANGLHIAGAHFSWLTSLSQS